jgi:mRNA interferase RelE/StbE
VTPADSQGPYQLIMARSAARAVAEVLPQGAAWAVREFIDGPLLENPHRVGGPLRGRLEGKHAARVGEYRVEYEIDDEARTVKVLRVARRADIYGIA